MARLVIVQGDNKGSVFEVEGEVTLGRSSSNPIPLTGSQISRVHARIVRRGDAYVVHDEESRNGVLVNGRKVQEQKLARGDEIQIGNVVLVFDPDYEMRPAAEGNASVVLTAEDPAATVAIQKVVPAEADASAGALVPGASAGAEVLSRRLKALYEATRILTGGQDPAEMMRRLLDLLVSAVGAERGAILLERGEEEGGPERVAAVCRGPAADRIAISRTVLAEVRSQRQAILSANAPDDPRFDASESLALAPVKGFLCAPLFHEGRFIGAIYLDAERPARPFTEDDLQLVAHIAAQSSAALVNAAGFVRAREENAALRRRLQDELAIVGRSARVQQVLDRIRRVAETDSTVLITGETGTGKELVARAIHFASARRARAFVPVDCSAMAESLLESELFGHERGAFTGADAAKPGKFELAGGGTLFLDEVGNMNLATQSKLLRVLEERKYTRVGGVKVLDAGARIVAATNADLEAAVRKGAFRQDLYFRLAVVPIVLPPLRDRREDIPVLVRHFLDRFADRMGEAPREVTPGALEALAAHDWPGNVRELRNALERAVVLSEGKVLDAADLPLKAGAGAAGTDKEKGERRNGAGGDDLALHDLVERVETEAIRRALARSKGNKSEAARLLRISRPTLDKKLRDYGIEV